LFKKILASRSCAGARGCWLVVASFNNNKNNKTLLPERVLLKKILKHQTLRSAEQKIPSVEDRVVDWYKENGRATFHLLWGLKMLPSN
jgi:hypothetical protein